MNITKDEEKSCERLSNEEMVDKILSFDTVKFIYDGAETKEINTSWLFNNNGLVKRHPCCSDDKIYDLSDKDLHFIAIERGDEVQNFYRTEQGWENSITKAGHILTKDKGG